jgi:hypothetical protein
LEKKSMMLQFFSIPSLWCASPWRDFFGHRNCFRPEQQNPDVLDNGPHFGGSRGPDGINSHLIGSPDHKQKAGAMKGADTVFDLPNLQWT